MAAPPTHRGQSAPFVWAGGEVRAYKDADGTFHAVTRQELTGTEHGQGTSLRYFEVGPGGHTTLERHKHTHVVVPLRGRGSALIVDRVVALAPHDVVFVPSWGWHQFRATAHEPFGFLCAVVVDRDRPVLPTEDDLVALRRDPAIAAFIRV
ncbi:cupin domain-containing protein [Actinoplanes sp. KI2]|uniref:cupin domain-containing protein n=1 Tax=Actinoplanes sp. KI2 TaxID=2983315 RepID=UPI0021D5E6FE|nr:cupin domain-containing protein [Actinoplanes sp. KI2]MCU7730584.1 cupin domain-containing protein [Actinoplanes sp. KI2]